MIFGGIGSGKTRTQWEPRVGARDLEYEIEIDLEEAFKGSTRRLTLDGKRIEVKIPAGVKDGSRIRLAGQGVQNSRGRKGDLYLITRIRPHPRFERRGDDLYVDVDVDYTVGALGGEVQVPTMTGTATMKIPPGTSSGRTFRLAGQGMPKLGGTGRGDLYARVRLTVPKTLSARQRELLGELARLGARG